MGVWLFYVQHQFEETSWAQDNDWNMHEAALHGSSHYDLPPLLRWFTGNIGVHHVHHLCSRIPFYRLPEVLRDHPQLTETSRLTIAESLHSVRLVLWDEERAAADLVQGSPPPPPHHGYFLTASAIKRPSSCACWA